MTQWIENPKGGRDRGPRAVARAGLEVIVRPRRFFRVGVAPGDQAAGLVFAIAVVLVVETSRLALVPNVYPTVAGQPYASAILFLGIAVLLVTPLALHLVAAIQTLLLIPFASDRAGVSETVQVLAYATAPCVAAGVPIPEVRAACAVYGTVLLFVGISEVHRTTFTRAALLSAIPAALVFGYGFRGFAAIETLFRQWYII